jgi:hypothetical protein
VSGILNLDDDFGALSSRSWPAQRDPNRSSNHGVPFPEPGGAAGLSGMPPLRKVNLLSRPTGQGWSGSRKQLALEFISGTSAARSNPEGSSTSSATRPSGSGYGDSNAPCPPCARSERLEPVRANEVTGAHEDGTALNTGKLLAPLEPASQFQLLTAQTSCTSIPVLNLEDDSF